MSSWSESIWMIRKIKSFIKTDVSSITGTTATSTTLADAIDILDNLNNLTFLQINPGDENQS